MMDEELLDRAVAAAARLTGIDVSQFATELQAMQAMRDGAIPSPQRYANVLLISLRITGTGAAYRSLDQEYVWRDPALYLNDEFLARCNGLPVILEHPAGNVLDSEEFSDRIVGMIALPFIKGDEIWGISKIYDAAAARMLETEKLSTSPAVVLKAGAAGGEKFQTSDGSIILIEGKPYLLDSLAICTLGVWDKGGPPAGVDNSISRGDSMEPRSSFIEAQSRASQLHQAFGDAAGAPPFVQGETLLQYRARLLAPFQKYSAFKESDLTRVLDPAAFTGIENAIFADAATAVNSGKTAARGQLIAQTITDSTGRRMTKFVGDPNACWDQFNPSLRHVRRILTPGTSRV